MPSRRSLLLYLALAAPLAAWSGLPGSGTLVREAQAGGRPRVSVFMTAWCRACQKHMRGLDREHIPYRAIDIEKDPRPYEPIREKLGRATIPVTIVQSGGEQRWVVGANSRAVANAYRELAD